MVVYMCTVVLSENIVLAFPWMSLLCCLVAFCSIKALMRICLTPQPNRCDYTKPIKPVKGWDWGYELNLSGAKHDWFIELLPQAAARRQSAQDPVLLTDSIRAALGRLDSVPGVKSNVTTTLIWLWHENVTSLIIITLLCQLHMYADKACQTPQQVSLYFLHISRCYLQTLSLSPVWVRNSLHYNW